MSTWTVASRLINGWPPRSVIVVPAKASLSNRPSQRTRYFEVTNGKLVKAAESQL